MNQINTAHYLKQVFPAYELDWLWMQENLQLDLAHLQLLRDFHTNWPEHDDRLLLVLLFLVDAVNQGSLCLLLNDPKLIAHAKRLRLPAVSSYIKTLDLNQLKLFSQPILVLQDNQLYFQKYHHQQSLLQTDLTTLIKHGSATQFTDAAIKQQVKQVVGSLPYQLEPQQIQALITALLQPFSIISGGPGTGKTTILLSLLRVFMGLGVAVDKICLAAPTGRAANRMTESIKNGLQTLNQSSQVLSADISAIAATTIHRLLGASPQLSHHRFNANNHLPYEVVVIDEVSMVDLQLMNQLIQAIAPSTRLVFLGDQFQLPSVQSGALLADLMPPVDTVALNTEHFLTLLADLWPSNAPVMNKQSVTSEPELLTDKVTLLQVSKRCQAHIAALSEWVRLGLSKEFINELNPFNINDIEDTSQVKNMNGVYWQDYRNGPRAWINVYQKWFAAHYLKHSDMKTGFVEKVGPLRFQSLQNNQAIDVSLTSIFKMIKSQRILTLTHGGPSGTIYINELFAGWLKNALQVTGMSDCFHGAVIMVKRNDDTLGLYNGDVGLVVEVEPNQFQVYFETADSFQGFSIHLIPDYSLAFAITVHKSQGSEFDHVLLPLTDQLDTPLLTREIIYTGMTRAKQSVIIFGSEAALKRAIIHKNVRHSGLRFWTEGDAHND